MFYQNDSIPMVSVEEGISIPLQDIHLYRERGVNALSDSLISTFPDESQRLAYTSYVISASRKIEEREKFVSGLLEKIALIMSGVG